VSVPELQAPLTSTEILLVDDDPKTLLAMEAMLADLGASLVTARTGRDALLRLLSRDFAVILLDVQMPEIDGFETAELIRERDKSRHTPIIFLTAFSQNDRAMLRGYGLGAVDFLFKPIVPEVLRSKVHVFIELQRKTQEVRRQARLIRDAESREHARLLSEERQRWESDNLRAQMEKERAIAVEMARKADELARAFAERDTAARALVQSNARLALLSDTANRLLTGHRPHTLLGDLFDRLTGHLDLDLYAHRYLEDDGETLTLQAHGGIAPDHVDQFRAVRVGDDGIAGTVAATRERLIIDDRNHDEGKQRDGMRVLDMTACVCFPLIAEERLIGTLAFGSRRRSRFNLEELAVLQMVADQIAIALERERLLDELQVRNGELADADRRKDEFLAMLAHELRNPLAPIVNALHVVGVEAAARGDSVSRAHTTMERQVRHLIRLVDDLLDVSRITQGKIELRREQTQLQAVIEHALQIARPLLKEREHTLVVDVPDAPLPVWIDVTRMTQVVANLVNNAAKYTNPRGTITITVERNDEEAVVRIKDSGIGIRPEMLPRVFELFVQADHANDRAAGGLGIGLTLVKRLVQMHGGEVIAQSEGVGKGSEFIVTVPIAIGDEAGAPAETVEAPIPLPVTVARSLRILVVEDNADIRETLKELLELEGHEVTAVVDGNAAVEEAGNGHEHDVALVDIGLPGLDGYGVARKLRDLQKIQGYPRRLIAMTGYGQAEDRRRALEAGFDAHLVKPVDPELLTRLLAAQSIEGDA
jgi:signal transduction histidine kinase/DNA-binding response OmpR family regulator